MSNPFTEEVSQAQDETADRPDYVYDAQDQETQSNCQGCTGTGSGHVAAAVSHASVPLKHGSGRAPA